MTNPMADAWLEAQRDLGIQVVHPFRFVTKSGITAETQGVYLPEFGSPGGILITCRFDSDEVDQLAEDTDFALSGLSPSGYEPYDRTVFIRALSDWGWYGQADSEPDWYDPAWRSKV